MKRINNIWIGSVLAALVAAIAVFAVMIQTEKKALSGYEKGTVCVATCEIPKGQRITRENVADYFEMVSMDCEWIPKTAFTDFSEIKEMTAAWTIEARVPLTKGMFEEISEVTKQMKEPVIIGLKAEDLYQVAGGVLRSGDRIHVYRLLEEGGMELCWKSVYVQQAFDNAGNIISNNDKQTAAQRINVYMDSEWVEPFYEQLAEGSLRIAKVVG